MLWPMSLLIVWRRESLLFPYGQREKKLCGIINYPKGTGDKQPTLWVKIRNVYDSRLGHLDSGDLGCTPDSTCQFRMVLTVSHLRTQAGEETLDGVNPPGGAQVCSEGQQQEMLLKALAWC